MGKQYKARMGKDGGSGNNGFNDKLIKDVTYGEVQSNWTEDEGPRLVRTPFDDQTLMPLALSHHNDEDGGYFPAPTDEGPKRSHATPVRPVGAHGDGEKT